MLFSARLLLQYCWPLTSPCLNPLTPYFRRTLRIATPPFPSHSEATSGEERVVQVDPHGAGAARGVAKRPGEGGTGQKATAGAGGGGGEGGKPLGDEPDGNRQRRAVWAGSLRQIANTQEETRNSSGCSSHSDRGDWTPRVAGKAGQGGQWYRWRRGEERSRRRGANTPKEEEATEAAEARPGGPGGSGGAPAARGRQVSRGAGVRRLLLPRPVSTCVGTSLFRYPSSIFLFAVLFLRPCQP